MNWAENAVFYQIYPLGMLGAPWDPPQDDTPVPRLTGIQAWIPHLVQLGVTALYLCPIFKCTHHGYDTADFFKIDSRLGTNETFAQLVAACHENNINVVVDGVFNHVGRDFFAFRDVQQNRESSPYLDWFYINFSGNSNYNDGFWYEGWEGHYELVKLNLNHPDVRKHLLNAVGMWIEDFQIDGLRLDVAYSLSHDFLRELSNFCKGRKPDFWLMGEALHGDYRLLMDGGGIDSVTNYECYKGLYSSFNDGNLFEIGHSLSRQFGKEDWTLYKGRHLFNFVDNHDVTRIASMLHDPNNLPILYALLFTMPGIPCLYYGSEWGITGKKQEGDGALRPYVGAPLENDLTAWISKLAHIHTQSEALTQGSFAPLHLSNLQFVFQRETPGHRVIVALNLEDGEKTVHFNANAGCGTDLLQGGHVDFGGGLRLPPRSAQIIRI